MNHARLLLVAASSLCTLAVFAQEQSTAVLAPEPFHASAFDANVEDLNGQTMPPMLGMHWARDAAPAQRSSSQAPLAGPNMSYHGGKIMPVTVSKAIFWGRSWTASNPKIGAMDNFYTGHLNSHYADTVNEYTGTNGQVTSGGTHQGHVVDTTAAANGILTGPILNEVCKQISAGNIVPDLSGNGYYPVYVDLKRGSAGFCAWHSYGTCAYQGQQVPLQFAFFYNLDADSGCDPNDTQTGRPQGAAALGNVSAHEIAEARSDPGDPGGWYDDAGSENGDKCAWTFNVPYVIFSDGRRWKVQGEWSNAAYNAGTGYPNSSGQRGCLDGH